MAVELSFRTVRPALEGHSSQEESASELLERAAGTWRRTRALMEAIDPSQLDPAERAAYGRMLSRIGVWADGLQSGFIDDTSDE